MEKARQQQQEQNRYQRQQQEICRFLRAKNGYGTLEGGDAPFILTDNVTTTYRCLCTGEPFGPDDELAHTSVCTSARGCFEAMSVVSESTERE